MTTKAAEELYLAQHVAQYAGKNYAVFNPHNKAAEDLPVIYGFNNGGNLGFLQACLMAEDGTDLGSHGCSNEAYMYGDLGILEDYRPDRHETFQQHYPDGYRMDFVSYDDVPGHAKLNEAFRLNDLKRTNKEQEK